ncbi:MAG TPA: hypothetical protein VK066_03105 [Chloroflexota bacterium]|nr:hypothetical protein [Chloroflexota bacterium]
MTAKPSVRALRPTHLVGLRAFDARGSCVEITPASWPRIVDGDGRMPFWSLLAHSVAQPTGHRRAWVHVGEQGIDGLVVARVRCGGLVWDVRHLWADADSDGVAQELLRWFCGEAASRGARRVFLETGPDESQLSVAARAGFERYTWAALYHAAPDAQPRPAAPAAGRPRHRGDEHLLFQLYNAAVPGTVRAAEALTLEEWLALHKGNRRWTPGVLTTRRQHVWADGDTAWAWLELASAGKSYHADWLVHPARGDLCDEVVAHALEQAARAPLYATCREYQQPLAAALERAGFGLLTRRAVFARQLAVRVAEPRLVAAHARPTLGGTTYSRW